MARLHFVGHKAQTKKAKGLAKKETEQLGCKSSAIRRLPAKWREMKVKTRIKRKTKT